MSEKIENSIRLAVKDGIDQPDATTTEDTTTTTTDEVNLDKDYDAMPELEESDDEDDGYDMTATREIKVNDPNEKVGNRTQDKSEYDPKKFTNRQERYNARLNKKKGNSGEEANYAKYIEEIDKLLDGYDAVDKVESYNSTIKSETNQGLSRLLDTVKEVMNKPVVDKEVQVMWGQHDEMWDRRERAFHSETRRWLDEMTVTSCFADWSTYKDDNKYMNLDTGQVVWISHLTSDVVDESYRAVTEGTPKNFKEALQHSVWGESARKELNDVTSKAMIEISDEIAKEAIARGCDVVTLFPVYEEKMRDGVLIRKVRLVGDGRTHNQAGATYSPTPSREEFLMYAHMIAANDWEWVHVDEDRAFLSANRQDHNILLAKMRGMREWYSVKNALYGLKTSTKDHSIASAIRLIKIMNYKRKGMCSNIFVKDIQLANGKVGRVMIYQYVDDYFFTGNLREAIELAILEFKSNIPSSEANWNPAEGLGLEFERDRIKKTISIRMTKRIKELSAKFMNSYYKNRNIQVPIPKSKYYVEAKDYEDGGSTEESERILLSTAEQSDYLSVVGGLLWIGGIRWDIIFAVIFLTWFTKMPRALHMDLAIRTIRYLEVTLDVPLVLGGVDEPQLITLTDASLASGPQQRSIIAYGTRLGEKAGFISAKVKATPYMSLSSFEAELNGHYGGFKDSARLKNVAEEMEFKLNPTRVMRNDNEKAVEFLRGEAEGKGVRHATLRLWYLREEIMKGDLDFTWESGETIAVDPMTKPQDANSQERFRRDVQGLRLLE
jgi:hypothetical protein